MSVTTILARLALAAGAAVAGAAVADVVWRGRLIERDREWRQRFNRLRTAEGVTGKRYVIVSDAAETVTVNRSWS